MRLSFDVPAPGDPGVAEKIAGTLAVFSGGILKKGAPVPGTIPGVLAGIYKLAARPPGCRTKMYPGLLPHCYPMFYEPGIYVGHIPGHVPRTLPKISSPSKISIQAFHVTAK